MNAAIKGKRVLLLVPPIACRATDFVLAANRLELDLVIGSNGALLLTGNTPDAVAAAADKSIQRRLSAQAGVA